VTLLFNLGYAVIFATQVEKVFPLADVYVRFDPQALVGYDEWCPQTVWTQAWDILKTAARSKVGRLTCEDPNERLIVFRCLGKEWKVIIFVYNGLLQSNESFCALSINQGQINIEYPEETICKLLLPRGFPHWCPRHPPSNRDRWKVIAVFENLDIHSSNFRQLALKRELGSFPAPITVIEIYVTGGDKLLQGPTSHGPPALGEVSGHALVVVVKGRKIGKIQQVSIQAYWSPDHELDSRSTQSWRNPA
jgi:hypothetical protein